MLVLSDWLYSFDSDLLYFGKIMTDEEKLKDYDRLYNKCLEMQQEIGKLKNELAGYQFAKSYPHLLHTDHEFTVPPGGVGQVHPNIRY